MRLDILPMPSAQAGAIESALESAMPGTCWCAYEADVPGRFGFVQTWPWAWCGTAKLLMHHDGWWWLECDGGDTLVRCHRIGDGGPGDLAFAVRDLLVARGAPDVQLAPTVES